MNMDKIQLDICKELIKGNDNIFYSPLNNNELAVRTDGMAAYVFDAHNCVFDLSRLRIDEDSIYQFEPNIRDEELRFTRTIKITDSGAVLEEHSGKSLTVYIDTKLAKKFIGCRLYAYEPHSRVLVKNDLGKVVGLIMPVRYEEE